MTSPFSDYAILAIAGWTSGISVYLTVGILGLGGRLGWFHLPGNLAVFSNPIIIAAAFFMFFIEFFADKVPFIDSAWDSVHTLIRPAGGFLIGFLGGAAHGPVAETLLAILTGSLTLGTHTMKSATRLAINASPEPFSNIAASLTEQSAVLILFWIFIRHPFIATLLVLLATVGAFFVVRALWRFAKKVFSRKKTVFPEKAS